MPTNKKVVKVTFMGYWCLSCPWYIILCILWSHHILLVAPKLGLEVNPILHGGIKWIPRLIIVHQSSWNALKGLIFHDFVPFNIRKDLDRPFLGFLFEISKKSYIDNFFHIQFKGGTLLYMQKCIGFWVLLLVKNGNN